MGSSGYQVSPPSYGRYAGRWMGPPGTQPQHRADFWIQKPIPAGKQGGRQAGRQRDADALIGCDYEEHRFSNRPGLTAPKTSEITRSGLHDAVHIHTYMHTYIHTYIHTSIHSW